MGPSGVRLRSVDWAIDAVLARLEEPWSLERMAAVAGYSPHHFHRLFADRMGETPQAFVARVRVERAAELLASAPDMAIADAADEVGFRTPGQLSRAFARRFGTAPSRWNRTQPLHDRSGHRVLARFPLRDLEGAGTDDVEVRREEGFAFAYVRVLDPYGSAELAGAWEALGRARPGASLIGMSWDDPDVVPAERCRYDLGLRLGAGDAPPDGTTVRWTPSATVAALRCRGSMDAVDRAWQLLARSWLPGSAYRRSPLPAMERFHADPAAAGWAEWDLDCVLPVR